ARGPAAGDLRGRRPVHRPHCRPARQLLRRGCGGARVAGRSGLPAPVRPCRAGGPRGRRAGCRGRDLSGEGGAAVLDPRREPPVPVLGLRRPRHDQHARGAPGPRGGAALRLGRDGHRLRLLARRPWRGGDRRGDHRDDRQRRQGASAGPGPGRRPGRRRAHALADRQLPGRGDRDAAGRPRPGPGRPAGRGCRTGAGRGITAGESRGGRMTATRAEDEVANRRLDAFGDAAFAFSVTLLLISGGAATSLDDLVAALGRLPAFLASFALIAMFWLSHRDYGRMARLRGPAATLLSLAIVFVVLVYVFPLRLLTES